MQGKEWTIFCSVVRFTSRSPNFSFSINAGWRDRYRAVLLP